MKSHFAALDRSRSEWRQARVHKRKTVRENRLRKELYVAVTEIIELSIKEKLRETLSVDGLASQSFQRMTKERRRGNYDCRFFSLAKANRVALVKGLGRVDGDLFISE